VRSGRDEAARAGGSGWSVTGVGVLSGGQTRSLFPGLFFLFPLDGMVVWYGSSELGRCWEMMIGRLSNVSLGSTDFCLGSLFGGRDGGAVKVGEASRGGGCGGGCGGGVSRRMAPKALAHRIGRYEG